MAGHWLGLLHTFDDEFVGPDGDACFVGNENDFVDDTPTMAGPSDTDSKLH